MAEIVAVASRPIIKQEYKNDAHNEEEVAEPAIPVVAVTSAETVVAAVAR